MIPTVKDEEVKLDWAMYQARLWLEIAGDRLRQAGHKREAWIVHNAMERLSSIKYNLGQGSQSA